MKLQKENNIRLLVKDEQSLYSPFSPDAEFSEPVKSYIRAKTLGDDFKQQIKLTVISSAPLDEERFRTADPCNYLDHRYCRCGQGRGELVRTGAGHQGQETVDGRDR